MSERDEIIRRLEEGESLSAICRSDSMPSARTVYNWIDADDEFGSQITRAREIGYQYRADKAVEDAKKAEDATKGRLAFDAERWYLGKMSNAFSEDKPKKLEHSGPNGSPIKTEGKTSLDVSSLNDAQLRALASIRVQPE